MPLIKRVAKFGGCRSGFVLGFAVALVVLQLFTFSQVTVLFEPGESSAPSHREASQLAKEVGVCFSHLVSAKCRAAFFILSHCQLAYCCPIVLRGIIMSFRITVHTLVICVVHSPQHDAVRADAGVQDGHARHLQLHDRGAKWPQLTEDGAAPNTAAPKPSTEGKLQVVMAKQRGVVEPEQVKQDEAVAEPKDKVDPPSLLATQATVESHQDEQQSLTVVADEGEGEAGTICSITETDALSCLQRAKTEECRALIRNVTCLQMEGKLYDLHIPYDCPLGKSYMGQRLEAIGASEEGPPVRIAYVLTVHGRAVRQLKMLFKAIYHRDNFYYIHVDIVGIHMYSVHAQNMHHHHLWC